MLNATKLAVKSLLVFHKLCMPLYEILTMGENSCKNVCFIKFFVKGNPGEISYIG